MYFDLGAEIVYCDQFISLKGYNSSIGLIMDPTTSGLIGSRYDHGSMV